MHISGLLSLIPIQIKQTYQSGTSYLHMIPSLSLKGFLIPRSPFLSYYFEQSYLELFKCHVSIYISSHEEPIFIDPQGNQNCKNTLRDILSCAVV